MTGQHLWVLTFISCLLLKMAALCLSFFLVLVALLPQDSGYISRYHTHVQEKKEAKEEGQQPYHESEIFSRNSLYLSCPTVWWIPPSCSRGCWCKYNTFPLHIVAPNKTGVLLIRKNGIDIGKATSCLTFVHLMMSSWNPSYPLEPSLDNCCLDFYWFS